MKGPTEGTPNRIEKERIFSTAKTQCVQWAGDTLSHYFEVVDEKLFKLAEQAGSNADQNRYFHTRDEIGRHRDPIREQFLNHIQSAFDHFQQGMNTCSDVSNDPTQQLAPEQEILEQDLSLVDNAELEEKLAIASMSRKRSVENSENLYALNQRLSVLRGSTGVTDQGNPFAPGVFGEALQSATGGLRLDDTARLLIYKVFDNAFMASLGTLYRQLNDHFQTNGILPNLGYYIKKTPEEVLADLPPELKQQLSDISIKRQLELIKAIQLMQHRLHRQPVYQRPAGVAPLSAPQLLDNMRQLQRNAGVLLSRLESQQAVAANDTAILRQQIKQDIERTDNIDRNVIEIVGLLFEYMLNDQQLPDSVKTLLSYLHTPFLKIALIDKGFFNHPEHPARQLLNSLVAAGERWVEPAGKRKSEVFEQIRKVVQRVLTEFDNDIRLFSELALEFNQYLRQHSRRIRLSEKRAMQAAQGENKLKEIRLKVERYLKAKIGDIRLAPPVETLLFEPWANFLAFNLLRFGSRSEQWRQAALVADDVIWYCLPHGSGADIHAQKRLEELQVTLPKALQAGFDTVGYDHTQSQRLLGLLAQRRAEIISTTADNETDTADAPGTVSTAGTTDTADIERIELTDQATADTKADPLLEKLKRLKVDTWFEFDADGPEPQRVKLAWSNGTTMQFMFVNRLGQQVAVKSGRQLVRELRKGKTRKLPNPGDKPFFEKAMESVLTKLRQGGGGAAG